MGVVLSSHSETSAFSLTSGIIGFVSFAFTLGTFLRVIWANLETLSEAPHEVHAYLTTLRTELLEEKASLKAMRKNMRRHRQRDWERQIDVSMDLDEVTVKTMSDTVRRLIRQFEEIERPFLEPGEAGIADATNHRSRRRETSASPYYEHSAYASPPEKPDARARSRTDRDRHHDDDDEMYWAQRTQYTKYGFRLRFRWLGKKPQARRLFDTLTRVQIRRMARQVGVIPVLLREYGGSNVEVEDMIRSVDDRMSRFVGVRRVENSD